MIGIGCVLALLVVGAAPQEGAAETLEEPDTRVVAAVAPDFPWIAAQAFISAVVPVDLEVGLDGVPVSAKVGVDAPIFAKDAEAAALRWRFAPRGGGVAATTHVTIIFSFQARKNDGPIVNNEQKADLVVTFKPPREVELVAKPYVCYLPPLVTTKTKKKR